MDDFQFNERDLDEDFIENTSYALSRSLSSLSLARLQSAAQVAAAGVPANLATSFSFANSAGLPQTVINTCLSLCHEKISLEERLCVFEEQMEDFDKLVCLAQAGLLDVSDVFCAAAYFSEDNILEDTWQKLSQHIAQPQQALDRALALCAIPHELYNGSENHVDIEKVKTLIALGADVRDARLCREVFDAGDEEISIAFVRAGADAGALLDRLHNSRYSVSDQVKKLSGCALYMRLDDHTLMQTTFVPPYDLKSRIDTIYRFDLAQVSETRPDVEVEIQRSFFAELPLQTLEVMRDQLVALGGNPQPLASALRTSSSFALFKPVQPKA